ncbi:MAG: cation diffusion facilitator family transporter [Pseudorhodoplanes sp.]|nr:cation diffusion facilitator family transporter [Pseudorhodoplanes sp.]
MNRIQTFATGSIAIGFVVLALKYLAYHVTGSVALLSDAIESIVNIATAVAALIAIRYAAQPADADHPYGHHKAEYISAVLEGVLIVIAAIAILREAYFAILTPRIIDAPWPGLAINGAATLINALWWQVLVRQGRRHKSPALVADGQHLLTDVLSSLGVFAGLMLATLTGLWLLDPILAVLVALNILWAGWQLVKESLGGLLDEAVPPEKLARLQTVIAENANGAIEAHDLRTRRAGRMTFIEFHLVVAGTMSVTQAHDICDALERAIKDEVEDALISIHVEPDDKAKHSGIVVL